MNDDELTLEGLEVLVQFHILIEILLSDASPVCVFKDLWLVISHATAPLEDNLANVPVLILN